jgi:hypothetical protein
MFMPSGNRNPEQEGWFNNISPKISGLYIGKPGIADADWYVKKNDIRFT